MQIVPIISSVNSLGTNLKLPDKNRNYMIVDKKNTDFLINNPSQSLQYILKLLNSTNDENKIVEGLYVIDKITDKTDFLTNKDLCGKIYPTISKFNSSNNENIQTMLAGIYRKTQVPDAFGPLITMLIKNANDKRPKAFDPNEEIGGAILEYLRNSSSVETYKPKSALSE